jgi:hypothetical protein
MNHRAIRAIARCRVERAGLNAFAMPGCVLAVFVGGDRGLHVLIGTILHSRSSRHERLIRGGIHDLTL